MFQAAGRTGAKVLRWEIAQQVQGEPWEPFWLQSGERGKGWWTTEAAESELGKASK